MKEGQCGLRAGHVGQQKMRPEGAQRGQGTQGLGGKGFGLHLRAMQKNYWRV